MIVNIDWNLIIFVIVIVFIISLNKFPDNDGDI